MDFFAKRHWMHGFKGRVDKHLERGPLWGTKQTNKQTKEVHWHKYCPMLRMVRSCGNMLQLACSHSSTGIPLRLLFFFSLRDTMNVNPIATIQADELPILGAVASWLKGLGMSLSWGKHWGCPLPLLELEYGLRLLWSKAVQLSLGSPSSQNNGQLHGRNHMPMLKTMLLKASACYPRAFCMGLWKLLRIYNRSAPKLH